MTAIPGWTQPLEDDGWMGDKQRFPTARQIVCWVDCPTCGAEKGSYCSDGRRMKKTGELLDLTDWIAMHGVNAPAPSCERRCQRGRSEFKKRLNMEKRRQESLRKAVDKVLDGRRARKKAKQQQEGEGLF